VLPQNWFPSKKKIFIQGPANEGIQTLVLFRNLSHIMQAAEIGTEEECALFAAKEKLLSSFNPNYSNRWTHCNNCKRVDHKESPRFVTGSSMEFKVTAPSGNAWK
jgi:hypothetical protein